MDNVFRIKKSRDVGTKAKASETVSGTLDSIHQTLVSTIKGTTLNLDELKRRKEEIQEELEDMIDVYKATKLREELRTIQKRLNQDDP